MAAVLVDMEVVDTVAAAALMVAVVTGCRTSGPA